MPEKDPYKRCSDETKHLKDCKKICLNIFITPDQYKKCIMECMNKNYK